MNRALVAVVATAALLLVGALVWWFGFRDDSVQTAIITRGSIDVTIQTIGRVESTSATTIRSRTPGEVETVAVQPGDLVVEGDILLQLEQEPLERAHDDAIVALEEAEFALQRAQREATDDPENEDLSFAVVQADQTVENRQRGVADAERALMDSFIVAPRDGIVLDTSVSSGDLINRSQPVATMYARDDLEVVADVDELDLANVNSGADAVVRLDAYPSNEIEGEVISTSPAAQEQGGATVFSTTIAIDIDPSMDIRPGMNADVTIVTDARNDVLIAPQQAIRTIGERAFVNVLQNGDRVEQEVILGYRSGDVVEIVSGLSEGDRVALQ